MCSSPAAAHGREPSSGTHAQLTTRRRGRALDEKGQVRPEQRAATYILYPQLASIPYLIHDGSIGRPPGHGLLEPSGSPRRRVADLEHVRCLPRERLVHEGMIKCTSGCVHGAEAGGKMRTNRGAAL